MYRILHIPSGRYHFLGHETAGLCGDLVRRICNSQIIYYPIELRDDPALFFFGPSLQRAVKEEFEIIKDV